MNYQFPPEFVADARTGKVFLFPYEPEPTMASGCKNCGGRGFMVAFYSTGEPSKFHPGTGKTGSTMLGDRWYEGEYKTAPCPVCSGGMQALWIANNCGLVDNDLLINLDNLAQFKGQQVAINAAKKLVAKSPAPYGFVTLWGGYGTGKTTILKAMVNGFRNKMVLATYARMSDMLAEVRETFADNSKNGAEKLIADYRHIRVLCIDEIDRINNTAWTQEVTHRLLDARYEKADTLLTVMASNNAPNQLPEAMEYLGSRMSAGIVIELSGADVRPLVGEDRLKDWTV